MGDLCYAPLIRDMTWSFSRVSSFDDCPYRWFLHYICGKREENQFYASYGSFMHRLLAGFYRGEYDRSAMLMKYLAGFLDEVKGLRPSPEVAAAYAKEGAEYIRSFRPVGGTILGVEEELRFSVNGIPFVGFADLVTEDERGIHIIDHKSRAIRQRKEGRRTKNDDEIDDMLRQLYLYAEAAFQKWGKYPATLCFNCFRNGVFIEEPFDPGKCEEVKRWAEESIRKITEADEFDTNPDWFRCRYLCGFRGYCEEGE